MGALSHSPVDALVERHGVVSFVETGTARGDSLACAAAVSRLTALHSIEIVPELVTAAKQRFKDDPRVCIWAGNSAEWLPAILASLPPGPCLFWLDAHFPGAHTGADYAAEADVQRRLPLEAEVAAIAAARPGAGDVLLLDDARIYQPGPYPAGNLPDDWPPLAGCTRSLEFVRKAYGATHGVVVDYADQGYVMVVPRAVLKKAA